MTNKLTPTNGVHLKSNGKYVVWVRPLGGQARVVGEHYPDYNAALQARAVALAGATPGAIGVSRHRADAWVAYVRWRGRTYRLGRFATEAEAAACRCAFDEWAAYQDAGTVTAALERYRR